MIKKYVYQSSVVEVIWPCKTKGLLEYFQLVDTPGLNQELLEGDLEPAFKEYYGKADGVIFLLDATKLSAKNPIETLINSKYDTNKNMICVINKIDRIGSLDSDNVKRAVEYVKERFGDRFLTIVPISALKAYEGIIEKDDNKIAQSGYEQLVKEIKNLFLKSGMEIRSTRKIEGLKDYTNKITQHVQNYKSLLNEDIIKYKKLKKNFYNSIDGLNQKINKYIEEKLSDYYNHVRNNIIERAEIIFEKETEEGIEWYIRNVIFDEEYLQDIISDIWKKIKEECTKEFEYWKNNSYISEYKYIQPSNYLTYSEIAVSQSAISVGAISFEISDVEFYTGVGTFLASILLLGPVGLIVTYLAGKSGFLKWATKSIAKFTKLDKIQRNLFSQLSEIIPKIKKKIIQESNLILQDLKTEIDKIRDESFARLYYPYKDIYKIEQKLSILDSIENIKLPQVHLKDVLKEDFYGNKKTH